jgi:ferric-chelate reductase
VVVLVALANHAPALSGYIVLATFAYAADRAIRLLKTRLATATIRPLAEMGSTRVEVRGLNAGWRCVPPLSHSLCSVLYYMRS